jgi:hypothetical protein
MSEIDNNIELNQQPEIPEFIIERDDTDFFSVPAGQQLSVPSKRATWLRYILMVAATVLSLALLFVAYKAWSYYHNIGVPVSVTPEQNISKLQAPISKEYPEVVMSSDSILGVALDFYAIHGLKASIEFEEPDTADASVYLYSRCADHMADSTYIGSLVVNGEELQSDRSRLGYMAMTDGQMVIGISRSDKVKDYVMENGGSFFRQFILVSNGMIPSRFFLHGKVERRAMGRMNNQLSYIATRPKETL